MNHGWTALRSVERQLFGSSDRPPSQKNTPAEWSQFLPTGSLNKCSVLLYLQGFSRQKKRRA